MHSLQAEGVSVGGASLQDHAEARGEEVVVDETHPAGPVDRQVARYRHFQKRRVLWVGEG